jgi:dipeptidyl aminopeptidase/acylaminoacyl peptidase
MGRLERSTDVEVAATHASPWSRRLTAALLIASSGITLAYTGAAIVMATQLVYDPPRPITQSPAAEGLQYRAVSFVSRQDHLTLKAWLVPGVLPDGRLTVDRTIIVVHGRDQNRADLSAHLLELEAALARHGFAVLAFDIRGMGESSPAPQSFGYFEQRDVLGALDFLRTGPPAYPGLGRPHSIGGLGISYGAASLILAAAHEPAIRAIVSDSAYADVMPLLEREIPRQAHLPAFLTPGGLLAASVIYGIDYGQARPVAAIADTAPRPVFIIHGALDHDTPLSDAETLYAAARNAPNSHVSLWEVTGATHAQAYHVAGVEYVDRVTAFFNDALGAG